MYGLIDITNNLVAGHGSSFKSFADAKNYAVSLQQYGLCLTYVIGKYFPDGYKTIYNSKSNINMITTQSDEYLRERWESKSRWHITLSDGTEVYQDDERSGRPSWKDLRDFLIDNPHLSISKMYFGFRDNCVSLPDEADGYYFRYGLLSSFGGFEKHSFLVGYLKDSVLTVMKYELPEMTYLGQETRDIETAGESLIVCQNKLQHSS